MNCAKKMVLIMFGLAFALAVAAQDRLAVSVEPNWTKWKQNCLEWGLDNYGVKISRYLDTELVGGDTTQTGKGTAVERLVSIGKEPGAKAREFAADLGKAQLLSIGTQVGDSFYQIPECREAIDAFLARGGTILYHYNSNPVNIPARNGLGNAPKLLEPGISLQAEASAESKAPLLHEPNDMAKVSAFRFGGASAWSKWSDKQQTLIHKKGEPDAGLLLLFEGVRGKGSVIINRIDGVGKGLTDQSAASKALIENLIRHCWGKLEKGAVFAATSAPAAQAVSATAVPVYGLNPLYLNGLNKTAWWNKDWSQRLPLIVREPLGIDRNNLLVTVDCQLAGKPNLSSFRVLSVGGRELPSQARSLEMADSFRITFSDDFDANATNGYFIYCDGQPKPKPDYEEQVTLRRTGGLVNLRNRFTEATLSAVRPSVYSIQAAGCSTGNQFMRGYSFERLGAGFTVPVNPKNSITTRILDDGPLRKTIEYSVKDKDGVPKRMACLSMDAGSRLLQCEYATPMPLVARWCPGTGLGPIPDAFVWPSKSGVRKIGFTYEDQAGAADSANDFSEGWYAFTDGATGQAVGELFEPKQNLHFQWEVYGAPSSWGYMAKSSTAPGRRALVALPDGYGVERLRQEYLAFKNPPQLALGAVQTQGTCPAAPAAPVWNKSFIATFHIGLAFGRDSFTVPWDGNYSAYFDEMLPKLKERGFNAVGLFPYFWDAIIPSEPTKASFASELYAKAGKHGLANYLVTPGASGNFTRAYGTLARGGIVQDKWEKEGGFRLSQEKLEESLGNAAAKLAATRPLAYWLLDETCYTIQPNDTAAFRQTYGMEPVAKLDLAKLAEPAQHNTALFQIDAYTGVLRAMADATHKASPETIVIDQVNPTSMSNLTVGGPHDFEAHSDFLDSISMDLYGKHNPSYKYFDKLMLGMFNNRKAVCQVVGCTATPEQTYASIACPAMWGVKTFAFFSPRNADVNRACQEGYRTFNYFRNTGLGDLMASMHPSSRVALLRDREAIRDDIRHGIWPSRHDSAVGSLTAVRNLQTDILMTKYLTPDNLKNYPLLHVPAAPALADKHVKAIEDYVKSGGHAIIEGETIRSPAVQSLTGLKFDGKTADAKLEVKNSFSFAGRAFAVKPAGAELIQKADDGNPVLFERRLGAGTVTYLPFELSSKIGGQDDLQGFVRALYERLAGPQAVTVDQDSLNVIDSNLLTDGEGNYVFSAWNPQFLPRHVVVTWKQEAKPEVIVDFGAGTSVPFGGTLEFELGSDQVKQFFLGKKGVFDIPACTPLKPGSMPGYSEFPGQDVANYDLSSKQESVKRPAKIPGESYVAVYDPKTTQPGYANGAGAIIDTLSRARGIKAEKVKDLSPETLQWYDAVVVPNFGNYPELTDGWEKNLREYVLNGGSALLCHRSVGYSPCAFAPLPEVGQNALSATNKCRDMAVVAEHPVTSDLVIRQRYPDDYSNPAFKAQIDANAFKVGDTFRTGFGDYIALKPGKDGKVLVNGSDGYPALIAGNAGKGKAVLAGMAIGQDDKATERMAEGDGKILINSIYWLVGK